MSDSRIRPTQNFNIPGLQEKPESANLLNEFGPRKGRTLELQAREKPRPSFYGGSSSFLEAELLRVNGGRSARSSKRPSKVGQ